MSKLASKPHVLLQDSQAQDMTAAHTKAALFHMGSYTDLASFQTAGLGSETPADCLLRSCGCRLYATRVLLTRVGGWEKPLEQDSKSSHPPTSVSNKSHTLQTQDVQLPHDGLSRHDCQASEIKCKLKSLKVFMFEITSHARVPFVKRVE